MEFRTARMMGVAATAALLLSAYAAQPAYAEHRTQTDPARDLVRFAPKDAQIPAAGTRDMDVRRTTVTHTLRRVIIRLKMADLRASASHYSLSSIKTDGFTYGVEYYRLFGADAPSTFFLTTESLQRLKCPGRSKRFNASRDTLVLIIPRQCVGTPRWVRVGSGWYTIGPRDRIFGDDPRQVGGFPEDQGFNYSPRVLRG